MTASNLLEPAHALSEKTTRDVRYLLNRDTGVCDIFSEGGFLSSARFQRRRSGRRKHKKQMRAYEYAPLNKSPTAAKPDTSRARPRSLPDQAQTA
jgi:hypothetical protein